MDYYTIVPADFTPVAQKTGLNRRLALDVQNQEAYQAAMIELSADLNPHPPYGWVYFDPDHFSLFKRSG